MLRNRLGDSFATTQTGRDELESVAEIRLRAGRADDLTTVAARNEQGAVGLGGG